MHARTLGYVAITLLCSSVLGAQGQGSVSSGLGGQGVSPQGSALPGPPAPQAPRQATPPRDPNGTQQPAGTGRIRGRVVAADSGIPLRRAQVRLTAGEPRVMQVANTDADGRYEFTSLPTARYTISVTRSGYVTLQYGQQRPFEPGKPLQLSEGEVADKIDFALPRGSVITGKVVDETGEPIAGVRMMAQRYQYMPGGQRRLVSGDTGGVGPFGFVTDDLGQFRVYGLMPGAYVLSAAPVANGTMSVTTANGTAMASGQFRPEANDGFATTYYPGTANVDEAQTITLGLGQEASAFFSLVSAHMGRVSGFVRNSLGRPAERTMVSLRTMSGTGSLMFGGSTTGPDGSFNIANVPPGEHYLDVRPQPVPGMGGASRPADSPAQPADDEFASVPITIAGQDITGLVITTGPGAAVSGRLIFEGTSPKPPTSQPLRVSPIPANPGDPPAMMMGMAMSSGVVDEAGRFQLKNLNGRLLFRAGAQGWNLKSVTLNGVDITDVPFDAKPSLNVTGLDVTMTDRQTTISGAVRDSRGQTVKDYVLAIFPSDLKEGAIATRFTRTVRPDQDGKFQLRGMPPGDYVAVAVESLDQGGEWDPSFQKQAKERGKSFKLTEGQLMGLDLQLTQ